MNYDIYHENCNSSLHYFLTFRKIVTFSPYFRKEEREAWNCDALFGKITMGNTEIQWAKQRSVSVEIASSRLLLHTWGHHPSIWGCGQGSDGPASVLHGPSPPLQPPVSTASSLYSQPQGTLLSPSVSHRICKHWTSPSTLFSLSGTFRFLPHLLPFPSGESPHPSSLFTPLPWGGLPWNPQVQTRSLSFLQRYSSLTQHYVGNTVIDLYFSISQP